MIRVGPILRASALSGAVALAASGAAAQPTLEADLILQGGAVYTPSGWAEAIAIEDGVIIAVGRDDDMNAYRAAGTEVIDLDGAAVLPGFHDMHVHPLGAGLAQRECTFAQGSPPAAIVAAVRACAERRGDGEWIAGGQWDAASFGGEPVDRRLLDEAAPNNPVVLTDISGHSAWANTAALELAGITASTPNPPGGIIERDADGRATGVLRESAAGLVRRLVPPVTPEESMAALRWALDRMLEQGITSFTDAVASEATLDAYATLADEGLLKQRVRACMMWGGAAPGSGGLPSHIAHRNFYARDRFSPTCVKLLLDGVPTDGHTAAMVEPYADTEESEPGDRGLLMMPQDALGAVVTRLDAIGLTVKMHAAGDAAVRAGLDAIEAARRANGVGGPSHELAHNSFVQPSDIERAPALGATFEMSPYIWYPNPIIPDISKAVGAERMLRWIPLGDAIAAGARVVAGSDWPVVPNVNPWIAIETLVTRQAPGGEGDVLGESQKISLEQAIELFTANAARQLGERDRLGTIERGMLADLVVVDRNPFEIPITEVHETGVLMTFIEGELVYRK